MSELADIYQTRVAAGEIAEDPAQRTALQALEGLRAYLEVPKTGRLSGILKRKADGPGGVYIWGGVGRGKSMLMDMFVETLAIEAKERVHFHEFMQAIHAGMNKARSDGVSDALAPVADDLVNRLRCLAIDEMQINDIADAMIVGRLFKRLFQGGVVVVTTSNRAPSGLYQDGLNRGLFLPFIDLIEARLDVLELVAGKDYRQDRLHGARVYFTPVDPAASVAINRMWAALTGGKAAPLDLTVQGRQVRLPAFHNGAARAQFWDLCGQPLGPADYLAIAGAVRVLVLENIPELSRHNFNEARRFVILIDALYEASVRLIASAARRPDLLYVEGAGSFEFGRTASRLTEMQSADWGSA